MAQLPSRSCAEDSAGWHRKSRFKYERLPKEKVGAYMKDTDGGNTATHSKALIKWTDWILLSKLILLALLELTTCNGTKKQTTKRLAK